MTLNSFMPKGRIWFWILSSLAGGVLAIFLWFGHAVEVDAYFLVRLLATAFIVLSCYLAYKYGLSKSSRRWQVLEQAIHNFVSRDKPERLPETSQREVNSAYQVYNRLLEKLEEEQKSVQQETKRLEAINRIISLTDFNSDLDKIHREVLKVILELGDLDYAALFETSTQGEIRLRHKLIREGISLPEWDVHRQWGGSIKKAAESNQILLAQEQKSAKDPSTETDLSKKMTPTLAAIPLASKGKVNGVMVAATFRRLFFTPQELEMISSICQHLSLSLENIRLYQDVREKVIEATTFNRISQALSTILDVDQLLKQLLQIVTTSFGYSVCAILLYDKEKEALISQALWGYPPEIEERGVCLKISGRGLCIQVFQKGEPVLSNDVENDPAYVKGWPDCRSELAVPLKIGEDVIGVINVESDKTQAFSDKDLHVLTTLAGEISVLVRNARLFQEQGEQAERLLVADQINRAIASTLDLDQIFEIVSRSLKKVVDYDGLFFYFYNSKENCFGRVFTRGNFEEKNLAGLIRISASDTNMAKVVQDKQSFLCQELNPQDFAKPVQRVLYQAGMRSYVLIPIIDNDEVIGCFNLGSRTSHTFGPREIAICQAVANHLAVAIKNSRMYRELKEAYDNLKNAQQTLIDSERLRTLGEMTSGVVHDFNNLLATILGRTQILLQKMDSAEVPSKDTCLKNLKAMEKAATDGSQLLTRISQFGKNQSGLKLEPVKVNEVVIDSVELTSPRWKNQSSVEGIKIAVRTEPEGVGEILANPAELREVMMNLIINAVDALPQGGEIVVRTGEREETVWIEVSDNGIGMSPELKDKIFQPFFTTKGKKGTGLGLPICLSIVSRFQGEIKTESESGKGTIFTLNFPRYTQASPMPILGRLRQEELVPKN